VVEPPNFEKSLEPPMNVDRCYLLEIDTTRKEKTWQTVMDIEKDG
jgi:hypothetical protein